MKICIFSDIHGNMLFFDGFLRAVEKERPDRLVFLGDSVSYYPDGCAVIRRLREIGALCVEGNHDSMLRGEFPIPEKHEPVYQLRRTMREIRPDELEFVKSWPEIVRETIGGKRITFVHGSPLNHLKGYSYADYPGMKETAAVPAGRCTTAIRGRPDSGASPSIRHRSLPAETASTNPSSRPFPAERKLP